MKGIFALILLCYSSSYIAADHNIQDFVTEQYEETIGNTEGHGTVIETDPTFQLNTCDVPGYRVLDKKDIHNHLIYICGGGILGEVVHYELEEGI